MSSFRLQVIFIGKELYADCGSLSLVLQYMKQTVQEGTELMPHRGNEEEAVPPSRTVRTPIRKNSRNRARETPSQQAPSEDEDEGILARPRKQTALLSRLI